MEKWKLVQYLDDYLAIKIIKDDSKNWLQVDCSKKEIKKIWYAVDASAYIFDKAIAEKVDILIVHHWMFWGFDPVVTWVHYDRIKKLIKNDIALYWAHLPLDAHSEVGNNIWIIKAFVNTFWIKDYNFSEFWEYKGEMIGYWVTYKNPVHIWAILSTFVEKMQLKKEFYNFWKIDEIKSLAVISWWWWDEIFEAKQKWYDLYITWEVVHHQIINAKDIKQSILIWWHYETEKIWVKLLAHHLEKKHKIETIFLDEKY